MTAQEVVDLLELEPLAEEGGMWTQSWRDPYSSAIYFLIQPDDFSALHRLSVTELWHHYAGAPVRLLLLHPDGEHEELQLGTDLRSGERPFGGVDSGVWMGAETLGEWSLIGTTMAPPFEQQQFELGSREELLRSYPQAAAGIRRLTRG